MEHQRQKVWQAASCLLCMAVACKFDVQLDGTEFMGGVVTGPLLQMQDIGCISFLLAAALAFRFRRVAAAVALLACLLCLPLYLLFTAPGPFRWVVGGEWKTPLMASFVWDWWSIGGLLAVAFATLVAVKVFPGRVGNSP
jgi:hypothetical protein